jgi:transaldolase
MNIFIDSADIEEIRPFVKLGIVHGVTTNPSLVAKNGGNFTDLIKEICDLVDGPVSAEVAAIDAKTMIEEGLKLAKISEKVTVKVPLTFDGLEACNVLSKQHDIPVNVTLCFSATQALLAAHAGATFISPFIGRLDDLGQDGMELIRDIVDVYAENPNIDTAILAASIRIPAKILKQCMMHPLTDVGVEIFTNDWKKTGQKI